MLLNTMTITVPAGTMSIREIERELSPQWEHSLQLSEGLRLEKEAGAELSGGQFEVRWLTNWSDGWVDSFAKEFTAEHPVTIKFVERRETEGVCRDRYVAGARNHLMPGGVNPRLPAVREIVFVAGERSSVTEWEESWRIDGTTERVNTLRSLEVRFALIAELTAAVNCFDDGPRPGPDADREMLAMNLRDAAHSLTAAISMSAS